MSEGIVTASYVGATILFILALGGLSNQETARRGNLYGMIGMAVALIATIAGVTGNMGILIVGLLVGGSIGLVLAKRVQMTEMPELVAILHSLVGLAAVLVGFANFMDPERLSHYHGVELTIHDVETYLGILIGAILQISSGEKTIMWVAGFAVLITSINIVGGFAVTRRMLEMFRK